MHNVHNNYLIYNVILYVSITNKLGITFSHAPFINSFSSVIAGHFRQHVHDHKSTLHIVLVLFVLDDEPVLTVNLLPSLVPQHLWYGYSSSFTCQMCIVSNIYFFLSIQ